MKTPMCRTLSADCVQGGYDIHYFTIHFISFTLRELGNEGRGWILLAALSRSRNALWVVSSASVMFPEFPGSLDVTVTVLVPKSEYTNRTRTRLSSPGVQRSISDSNSA
jgi:hypothetical protein